MQEVLLGSDATAQQTLTLSRLLLSQENPALHIKPTGHELCFYSLVGGVDMALCWGNTDAFIHLEAPRKTVQEPSVHVLRLPAGHYADISVLLTTYAADILCVSRTSERPEAEATMHSVTGHYVLQDICYNHDVGTGTHHRFVREIPTPLGYTIHCGETLNDPGAWSSWPSHAAPDEVGRYAEHEELFFVVTPGYGIMRCDGAYPNGAPAPTLQEVHNGEALRTPLGSHEIVFSPGDWGWYFWAYRSFLKKQYNKYATDGVKTYVK